METLTVRKRVENLQGMKRKKRDYEKKDDDYWQHGKCEISRQKRAKIDEEVNAVMDKENQSDLTVQELRKRLKAKGIITKKRDPKVLAQMLRSKQ